MCSLLHQHRLRDRVGSRPSRLVERLFNELDPGYLAVAVGDRIPVSSGRDAAMPEFMDVHRSMKGVTPEQLLEAHNADLAIQGEESVDFKHAWADPASGMVFCLSEGPNEDAVRRIHERAGHPADEIYEVSVQA
jgi:hypothetical protein